MLIYCNLDPQGHIWSLKPYKLQNIGHLLRPWYIKSRSSYSLSPTNTITGTITVKLNGCYNIGYSIKKRIINPSLANFSFAHNLVVIFKFVYLNLHRASRYHSANLQRDSAVWMGVLDEQGFVRFDYKTRFGGLSNIQEPPGSCNVLVSFCGKSSLVLLPLYEPYGNEET